MSDTNIPETITVNGEAYRLSKLGTTETEASVACDRLEDHGLETHVETHDDVPLRTNPSGDCGTVHAVYHHEPEERRELF